MNMAAKPHIDILERIVASRDKLIINGSLLGDAAKEIESLRSAIKHLVGKDDAVSDGYIGWKIVAAFSGSYRLESPQGHVRRVAFGENPKNKEQTHA